MGMIHRTSYGTLAYVSGNYVWDIDYRTQIGAAYIRELVRRPRRNEHPSYFKDSGRDYTSERGLKFDRSGKLKVRHV